jgi:hypothetical protein
MSLLSYLLLAMIAGILIINLLTTYIYGTTKFLRNSYNDLKGQKVYRSMICHKYLYSEDHSMGYHYDLEIIEIGNRIFSLEPFLVVCPYHLYWYIKLRKLFLQNYRDANKSTIA